MFIWVILAFWIVLGLGVFFVAFRGGRHRGAGGAASGETRSARRAVP